MSKSRQTRETARAMVNPLFAWTNAVLKGGEMMLDSLAAANDSAKAIRVAVLPDADAPRAKRRKAKSRGAKAKRSRRRR
jgi:hypothetical protein